MSADRSPPLADQLATNAAAVFAQADIGQRHREVLGAALLLFAERGYAGTSLRELARRLGMRQPSLYHYFRSKDELVEQILQHVGADFLDEGPSLADGTELDEVPALLAAGTLHLYEHTEWPLFVRFLFTIALAEPRFSLRLRELFTVRADRRMRTLMAPFVGRGAIDEVQAVRLVRMVVNAIALYEIEARLLYPTLEPSDDRHAFAEQVATTARAWLHTLGRS